VSLTSGQPLRNLCASLYPDRWIALSSLQKSIRRGAVEHALAAGSALWTEPSRLLDRILVIGLEDIGIGDPLVLSRVIELTTDRTWRRSLPDKGKAVTLGLVESMCAATKSRLTDELGAIAMFEPALGPERTAFAALSDESLADEITTGKDIGTRALAAWFLAGTDRYRVDRLPRRQGSLPALWQTYRSLGIPADWLGLLDRPARKMPWPLAVMLPLAYLSKASGVPTVLVHETAYETWRGVPLYALDMHTRRGLIAIGRWIADCPALQEVLQVAAPVRDWPKITRYAVFAVESQLCDRHLMWAEQAVVLRRSMLAELTGRGLTAEYMDQLLACATANLPALNERRREVLDEAPA
jgi:hypothetical protein